MIHSISAEQFSSIVTRLVGLKISRAWLGYGTAAVLELGELIEEEQDGGKIVRGESTVILGWSWRIEGAWSVLGGSASTRRQLIEALASLEQMTIVGIGIDGRLPELNLDVSNGTRVRTFMSAEGDPEWLMLMPDGTAVFPEGGELRHSPAGDRTDSEATPLDDMLYTLSEQASKRWSHRVPPSHLFGRCEDCTYFRPLEGEFHFYDFGVCSNATSTYDGQVVATDSGCPAFAESLASNN